MTPTGIKAEVAGQSWAKDVTLPTCSVAGRSVDTGTEARCFAQYMRINALEATGGLVYSQMGQLTAKPDAPKSELTPDGATALNTSYMATQLSLFSLVVGIALVLAGIGFAVLAFGGTRRRDAA